MKVSIRFERGLLSHQKQHQTGYSSSYGFQSALSAAFFLTSLFGLIMAYDLLRFNPL